MASEVFQLKVAATLQGQYRENVLNFESTGTDANNTEHSVKDLTAYWDATLRTLWLAMLPETYILSFTYCRRISAKPSATIRNQYQANTFAGALGGSATAQQCCPSIFMVPMMGFFIGSKIFLPAVGQGSLVGNVLQPAWFTAMTAFMNQAIGAHAGPSFTWQMGIWSKKLHAFSSVSGYHPSAFIGFMARRKVQSGRYRHKKKA